MECKEEGKLSLWKIGNHLLELRNYGTMVTVFSLREGHTASVLTAQSSSLFSSVTSSDDIFTRGTIIMWNKSDDSDNMVHITRSRVGTFNCFPGRQCN